MIINGQKIVDGTKEMYIYYLLKYTKYYPYKILPLYEIMDDNEQQLIKYNICKKNNNVIPKDGYNFSGEYFHCNYCNIHHHPNNQKFHIFFLYLFLP